MQLIEPGPARATLEQGFSYIKKGELGRAIAVMDELIQNDPYLAQAYWGRALCYEYRAAGPKDIELAISDYTKSIIYSSGPPALSYSHRGILYFKSGMLKEAFRDLSKALESDPFSAETLFYRGRAYLELPDVDNNLKLAENDFTDVIRYSNEPFAPAYFWRAQVRRLLGSMKDAVSDYGLALQTDPGDVLALNALAYCNEHGIGVKADPGRAEELYIRAAELGFTVAQKNLAWFYSGDENGRNRDAGLSASWMRKAALDGDAEAQYLYGLRLLYGKGVPRDELQAAHYFKLAAKQDYAPAMCNLADCYEQGLGVAEDASRAFGLYEKAAALGSELAKYNIGRYYYFGIGVEEDNDKAFAAFEALAVEGYARAQDMLGLCYENGFGTQRDFKRAGKWYRAAYGQGYAQAGAHLASRFRFGRGVKKNLAEAVRLYVEAGEKGLPYAYFSLGRLYFEDKCDYVKAAEAFELALSLGAQNVSVWLARALVRLEDAAARAGEAYGLLLDALGCQCDALTAAVLLFDFEFYGMYGFNPDPEAAVNRLEKLVFEAGEKQDGLSCAYYCLARAYELGLGAALDENRAAEFYMKAGSSAEPGGCRCFAAGFAHMLYRGVGCGENIPAADEFVLKEMDRQPSNESKLLYIWSCMRGGNIEDAASLTKTALEILREEPNDPVTAYTLYCLKRGGGRRKYLSLLKKSLETAPPSVRLMIESHMRGGTAEPFYPMLTAEIIDTYKKRRGKRG